MDRYLKWANKGKPFFEVTYRNNKMYVLIDKCDNDHIIFTSSSNGKLGVPISGTRLRRLREEILTDPILEAIIDGYYGEIWKAQRQALVRRIRS